MVVMGCGAVSFYMCKCYILSKEGKKLNVIKALMVVAGKSCRVPSSVQLSTTRKRKKNVSIVPSQSLADFLLNSCMFCATDLLAEGLCGSEGG